MKRKNGKAEESATYVREIQDPELVQLKAAAYDCHCQVQAWSQRLSQLNQLIASKGAEAGNLPPERKEADPMRKPNLVATDSPGDVPMSAGSLTSAELRE